MDLSPKSPRSLVSPPKQTQCAGRPLCSLPFSTMNICSSGHEEIVHEGPHCPLCIAEKTIRDLESEISDLKSTLAEVRSSLQDALDGKQHEQ